MTEENPIVEKIRKLLRRTTERGASSAEANTAMQMAQKLMTEHGISKVDVKDPDYEANKPSFEIVEVEHATGRQRYETDQYISRILHNCFSVRTLWGSDYELIDSKVGKVRRATLDRLYGKEYTPKVMKQRLTYWLYGDKLDVAVAEVLIQELHRTMRHFLNRHLKAEGIVWNAETCHSFFEGLTSGYIEANRKGKEEAMLAAGETARDQYALVVIDKDKATADHIKQNVQTVRSRASNAGARSGGSDFTAYASGNAVGKNLNLATPRIGKAAIKGKKS